MDAETKDGTRAGVGLKEKQKEKEPVTGEEESQQSGVFGMKTAKSLLNIVYYYNGKLFGLRGGEHRRICLNNFEIGDNYVRFEENACKTFHGGLLDLKYEPHIVRHICHSVSEHHEPCLIEYYHLYIGLVQICAKEVDAFYFRPNAKRMCFDKLIVGINTLNRLLPDMCEAAGIKRKTAHCLGIMCASSLFNAGVDSKLIRDRTGHRLDALMKYEKANEKVQTNVSAILGPKLESSTVSATVNVDSSSESVSRKVENVSQNVDMDTMPVCFGDFKKCTVNFNFK